MTYYPSSATVAADVNAAASLPTPNTLMRRDANGMTQVATPTGTGHASNKSYTDQGDALNLARLDRTIISGDNMVTDPQITDATFWEPSKSAQWSVSTDQSLSGTQSLKCVAAGGINSYVAATRSASGMETRWQVRAGDLFFMSAWVYLPSAIATGTVYWYLAADDSKGVNSTATPNDLLTPLSSITPGVWTEISSVIRVPSGRDQLRTRINVATTTPAGAVVYVDNLLVKNITPETRRPVIQEFNSVSGGVALITQPVPVGALGVRLTIIPAGNGGGSGRRGAPGTIRCGGGGGSSGVVTRDWLIPVGAATTWDLRIDSGGAGGAAVTTDNTDGNNGGIGTSRFRFGTGSYFYAGGTSSTVTGKGGTVNTGLGGTSGAGSLSLDGGSASTSGGNGGSGAQSWGDTASSAGAGGGITASNTPFNGGSGGQQRVSNVTVTAGGIAGGALPESGPTGELGGFLSGPVPGVGAGGGAASVTAAAQAGADGVGYGSPGGGGGASANGFASGRGGNGGPGYARLEWVYG